MINVNGIYAVGWSGGSYEESFHEERIISGKANAEALFNKLRDNATKDHYNDRNYYSDAVDHISLTAVTVNEEGHFLPDWWNPVKEIEWDYKCHCWEE